MNQARFRPSLVHRTDVIYSLCISDLNDLIFLYGGSNMHKYLLCPTIISRIQVISLSIKAPIGEEKLTCVSANRRSEMSIQSRCKPIMIILRQAQISTAKVNCLCIARISYIDIVEISKSEYFELQNCYHTCVMHLVAKIRISLLKYGSSLCM